MFNVKIKVKEANNSMSWPRRRRSSSHNYSPHLGYTENKISNGNGFHNNGIISPDDLIQSENRTASTSLLRARNSSKKKSLRHDKRVRIVTSKESALFPPQDEIQSFESSSSKSRGKRKHIGNKSLQNLVGVS